MNTERYLSALTVALLLCAAARCQAADPPAEPLPARTGGYSVSFPEHAPYASLKHVISRTCTDSQAREWVAKYKGKLPDYAYQTKDEKWAVLVPNYYQPEVPLGLFVFISAGDGASMGAYKDIMARHRLIFVSAVKSGNSESVIERRMPLALDAVYNLGRAYNLDAERIYISGFSGGGRCASWMAIAFSDVFSGGLYFCGCNCYRIVSAGGGRSWGGDFPIPSKSRFIEAQAKGRYVFITGTKDSNQANTKDVEEAYRKDGFKHTVYVEVPDMGHSSQPPEKFFDGSLDYLDAPLLKASDGLFKQGLSFEKAGQLGKAIRSVGLSIGRGGQREFVPEAEKKLAELKNQYADALSALSKSIDKDKPDPAAPQVAEFRKTWGEHGEADLKKLLAGESVEARKVNVPEATSKPQPTEKPAAEEPRMSTSPRSRSRPTTRRRWWSSSRSPSRPSPRRRPLRRRATSRRPVRCWT